MLNARYRVNVHFYGGIDPAGIDKATEAPERAGADGSSHRRRCQLLPVDPEVVPEVDPASEPPSSVTQSDTVLKVSLIAFQ
ncbi:hypothetical protein GCM10011583_65820 [Streptomyces camponoticapitis]|uniref:Uncharacterized protein n=1 Tax=Streptomyces camponoticapitis TaxID=1616125 RepID=A0ABQ2ET79_9ACTN|nr:hypothetical protein GCM10011583_65820 [Streptomyces camponoticapitis]